MRLLALSTATAAAALLSAGCGGHPCDGGNIAVDWQLQDLAGNPISCVADGVQAVDVFLDGVAQARTPCSAGGITILGVPAGDHQVTVEGIDTGSNAIINRDQFSVSTCGGGSFLARPGEATLQLQYSVPGNVCDGRGSFIWYQVTDLIAGAPISAITSASSDSDKILFDCGNQTWPSFPVPFGRYRIDWMEEVVAPLTSPVVVSEQCTASVSRSIWAPGTLALTADLFDSGLVCAP